MKTKIYLLSWVSFTGSDNYMYSDIQIFTDKNKAVAELMQQKENAYEECKWGSEWESEDKEDAYEFDVWEKTNSDVCYEVHSEAYDGYDVEIYLREKEIEVTMPNNCIETKAGLGDMIKWNGDDGKVHKTKVSGVQAYVYAAPKEPNGVESNTCYQTKVNHKGRVQTAWVDESDIVL